MSSKIRKLERKLAEGKKLSPRQAMIEFFNAHPQHAHIMIGVPSPIVDKSGGRRMEIKGLSFSLPDGKQIPMTVGTLMEVLIGDENQQAESMGGPEDASAQRLEHPGDPGEDPGTGGESIDLE